MEKQQLVDVYIKEERWAEAIRLLEKMVTVTVNPIPLYIKLGFVFYKTANWEQAAECYRKVVKLQADAKEAWKNLLIIYCEQRNLAKAVILYEQALAVDRNNADWCYGLGIIFHENNYPAEAIPAFRRALELRPDWADAHWVLGASLLKLGLFSEGFAEYEWRKKRHKVVGYHSYFAQIPQWSGEIFSGKKLLVYAEQGLGDFLQFMRYLPLVKARGGVVAAYVREPLMRLVAQMAGIDELVEPRQSIQDFDMSIALLSLPQIFGTTRHTIPQQNSYISVTPSVLEKWRGRIAQGSYKIGIVWGGNTHTEAIGGRSMPFSQLALLKEVSGITLYSLQKGEQAEEGKVPPEAGLQWVNLSPQIEDFLDTAGAIAHLDLVITIDTSVAHLAGAMGKAVWVLLPFNAEWRWLEYQEFSPWYPSMRLFRQKAPGNWGQVIGQVVSALKERVPSN